VARIAQKHLSSKAQQATADLVTEMKDPANPAHPPGPQGKYDVNTIACWMDDFRGQQKVDYASWHFTDIGLAGEGHEQPTSVGDLAKTDENVVTGLKRAIAVLKGAQDPLIPNKAQALAMVCHLVGDIHQPLHCATHYFGHEIIIQGKKQETDRGGNFVTINSKWRTPEVGDPYQELELHSFWDGAYRATFDPSDKTAVLESHNIEHPNKAPQDPAHPHSPTRTISHDASEVLTRADDVDGVALDGPVDTDFSKVENWAAESHDLALKFGYGPLAFAAGDADHLHTTLDADYIATARRKAQQRIKTAGLRLAAILNDAFK
jgi:hypothetical protein